MRRRTLEVFVLKIVIEIGDGQYPMWSWTGRIEHVRSGLTEPFHSADELQAIVTRAIALDNRRTDPAS